MRHVYKKCHFVTKSLEHDDRQQKQKFPDGETLFSLLNVVNNYFKGSCFKRTGPDVRPLVCIPP